MCGAEVGLLHHDGPPAPASSSAGDGEVRARATGLRASGTTRPASAASAIFRISLGWITVTPTCRASAWRPCLVTPRPGSAVSSTTSARPATYNGTAQRLQRLRRHLRGQEHHRPAPAACCGHGRRSACHGRSRPNTSPAGQSPPSRQTAISKGTSKPLKRRRRPAPGRWGVEDRVHSRGVAARASAGVDDCGGTAAGLWPGSGMSVARPRRAQRRAWLLPIFASQP